MDAMILRLLMMFALFAPTVVSASQDDEIEALTRRLQNAERRIARLEALLEASRVDAPLSQGEVRVVIEGAVKTPGIYVLPIGARIETIIATAGGFAQDVQKQRVSVLRADNKIHLITPENSAAFRLEAGDIFTVPQRRY
jgi:protein involved in polysaccharide export with SLBB domain